VPDSLARERYWQIDAEEEPDRRASEIWGVATALQQDQQWRELQNSEFIGAYEGRGLAALNASAYTGKSERLDLAFNLCRSLVDTVIADTAGKQRPKPQFLTSGADWQTRRRAKRLDQFVLGMMHQPQGRFADAWELMVTAWRDAAICDIGAVKVLVEDGQVIAERALPWELFVDPVEAMKGDPQTLFHITTMDRDAAVRAFCGDDVDEEIRQSRRYAIESAESVSSRGQLGSDTRAADQIQIVESWHLPVGDEPGFHDFALSGCLLHSEEWEWDLFPFVIYRWADDVVGWHGQSLVEESLTIQEELNDWAKELQENFHIRNGRRTWYRPGSVAEEHLQSNESETFVPVEEGHDYPHTDPTPPLSDSEFKYGSLLKEWGFQFTGVSQQSATSQKEPGITSGVAIRTMMDMGSKRFSRKLTTFENGFVTLARLFIRLAATIPGYKVKLPGRSTFQELGVNEVTIDEDKIQIRIRPASALPDEPGGRLQLLTEMFGMGLVSPDGFKRMLDWPDLDREFSRESAEYEWLETLIDRFLDATPEETATAYEPPEGFLFGLESAMVQMGAAYFVAKREGAPEVNLELLRHYIEEIEQLMERRAQQAAQLQAVQQGGPPGAGPGPSPPQMAAPGGPLPIRGAA